MLSTDPLEPMLRNEPAEAIDATLPALSTLSADATERADNTDQGDAILRHEASIIYPACQTPARLARSLRKGAADRLALPHHQQSYP